ncbi:helix-turn-helix domain-containing protein [Lacticaseibacillus songhuajiangensis]|jgi:cytoskeletal protein RodZ|uniref:helix-turn-helix domain-containing protein n=1 Tax=Lacticaseibacillus songhuajiangensis TaxID=1296539 RepID=UPI000F7B0881|nr:helix-turn-helix domain-containing protein [Lacticaseibacillus songhuajiangensis]
MDEIGQKLRDARLEKGYTIDDLQQITKIQKRYLIAIEEGNFDALPGDFYVRAFIKQYANVVGMNTEKLMEDYQQDIPTVQPTVEESANEEQPTRIAHREKKRPAAGTSRSVRRYWPQIAIGIAAIVIFAVVYGFTIAQQHKESKPSIPTDQSSVSVEGDSSSKKSSKKASSSSSTKSTKKKKSSSKLNISAATGTGSAQTFTVKNLPSADTNKITVSTTTAAAWMSVTIDGTQSWQGTLQSGGSHDVTIPSGAKTIVVKSGNAAVNEIAINGTKADLSSSSTVVRTMTFTIE